MAGPFLDLYRNPRSPQIHVLSRIAIMLGEEFSRWLTAKMDKRFAGRSQPPNFYWAFKNLNSDVVSVDYRLQAAHLSGNWRSSSANNQPATAQDLLANPSQAASLLSAACLMAFEHEDVESRAIARNLDYLAYGAEVRQRTKEISDAIMQAVGDEPVGELVNDANIPEEATLTD
jgi:hypothetical protein